MNVITYYVSPVWRQFLIYQLYVNLCGVLDICIRQKKFNHKGTIFLKALYFLFIYLCDVPCKQDKIKKGTKLKIMCYPTQATLVWMGCQQTYNEIVFNLYIKNKRDYILALFCMVKLISDFVTKERKSVWKCKYIL